MIRGVLFVPFVDRRLVNRREINPSFYSDYEETSAPTHNHRSPSDFVRLDVCAACIGHSGKMKITTGRGCIEAKSCSSNRCFSPVRQTERGYLNITTDFLFPPSNRVAFALKIVHDNASQRNDTISLRFFSDD